MAYRTERVFVLTAICIFVVRGAPGRLLISFAPAGKMEAFFNERDNRGIKPGAYTNDASFMRAYGMELLGPPIVVE